MKLKRFNEEQIIRIVHGQESSITRVEKYAANMAIFYTLTPLRLLYARAAKAG